MARHMLTTFDNPYNPFKDFSNWLQYDNQKGYGSAQYLARIANTSEELSDDENDAEIERAIDEIVSLDFTNNYKKVSE